MSNNRRDFLKKVCSLGGAGLISGLPFDSFAQPDEPEASFTITILQTTDVHCQIHPHDEFFWEKEEAVFRKTGGYANLATFLQQEKKNNPTTFIVDTGDMFQGSELSVKTTGKAMVSILNSMGYDLYLPGNWEVIYGKKNMQSLLGSLQSPKVCANMYHDLGDGKRGELIFPPYYIWNIKGVRIGFLGYTDPLVPIRQSPNYSKGILYSPPEENLAEYVRQLKETEKCDYLIILSHLGLSQQIALANHDACKGVDYIMGGDTHERVRKPIQGKHAKIVEPGAFGSFVGKLNLTVRNGKVIKDQYELIEIDAGRYQPDKTISDLIKNNELPFESDIYQVVGYSTIPLYRYFVIENPIDTLVLDAVRWKMKDVDIVLSNGFRFCPPNTTRDHTGNIPITNGFIYDMLPVDSVIRTGQVTGKQLKDWLETELNNVFAKNASQRMGGWVTKFNGMSIEFDAYGDKGKRVKKGLVQGKAIDENKIYSICACERDGDPADMLCRMKGVVNGENTPYSLHSVMRQYLTLHSPVTPTPTRSARALDAPQTLLTQVQEQGYRFS